MFMYYKLYRANVRIKVLCIQIAEGNGAPDQTEQELLQAYLYLFKRYYLELKALCDTGEGNPAH